MNAQRSLYIAETNEKNQVVWVWKQGKHGRSPRPVNHPQHHLAEVRSAQVWGASREAIVRWLSEQPGNDGQ